jgi:hypothetical protein
LTFVTVQSPGTRRPHSTPLGIPFEGPWLPDA